MDRRWKIFFIIVVLEWSVFKFLKFGNMQTVFFLLISAIILILGGLMAEGFSRIIKIQKIKRKFKLSSDFVEIFAKPDELDAMTELYLSVVDPTEYYAKLADDKIILFAKLEDQSFEEELNDWFELDEKFKPKD